MLGQYLGLLLLALSSLVVIEVKACTSTSTSTPFWSTTAPPLSVVCGPGEKFNRQTPMDACTPCPSGYYQNQTNHRSESCKKCSRFRKFDPRRVLVDDCTRFHDIVETCRDGFYMDVLRQCSACTNCSRDHKKFFGQACTKTSDAVCCDREDQLVKNGVCVAPKDFCPPGEFLMRGKVCRSCEECKPCFNACEESNDRSNLTNSGDERKQDGTRVGLYIAIGILGVFLGVC